ncbi:C45 family peptidase [Chelativorans sp. AA-79]|uniref:C45 family autoproteolytic acyltransferase/hydolase n=1 Tax=Chelativorans sp. AA-79 TaxID=3028735 RepID=UPI0023FA3C7D|nr:C45 family peptidase [Chelativorans sp. AA-79]WEX09793.1 C45 family autoproteolytic acyltransferase/hydrolase [Chelativorans sp. AA-79]
MADLPLLELGPDPRERGRIHGSTLADAIRDNIETYLARFEAAGADRPTILKQSEGWLDFIRNDNGEYAEEMAAIAEASGVSLTEIAMLNARYEITYLAFGAEVRAADTRLEQEGCTSFGLLPEATANGHTILCQNWDWLANVQGRTFIQRVRRGASPEEGKPDFIGFSEAGIVGSKMGVNAAGIGLCVNGLVTPRDGTTGMRKPFHVRCKEILDAWRFDQALLPVVQTDRTASSNYLIGHRDGEILDIEATPEHCAYLTPTDGLVVHANHLVKETRVTSQMERIAPNTLYRGPRAERLLRRHLGSVDRAVIEEVIRDHFSAPAAICRHPDPALPSAKRVVTVAAILLDLDERILYATDGPPCEAPFQAFPLYTEQTRSDAA